MAQRARPDPAGRRPRAVRLSAGSQRVNRNAAAFDVPHFTDWLGQATGEPPAGPVPTILAIGEDPAGLGAPFFVMSFVDGDVVRRNGLPEALAAQPESHHSV